MTVETSWQSARQAEARRREQALKLRRPSTVVLEFPAPKAWSTNKDRTMHHIDRWRHVQAWKEAVAVCVWELGRHKQAIIGRVGGGPSTVHVTIPFVTNRRRDSHNYVGTVVKAIVDGLVQQGFWPDDTPEYVTVIDPTLIVDKSMMCTVTITPRDGG